MLQRDALFHEITPEVATPHSKITVVGVGQVGMACAYSIMQQVCKKIVTLGDHQIAAHIL